jgi:hypothetical protein
VASGGIGRRLVDVPPNLVNAAESGLKPVVEATSCRVTIRVASLGANCAGIQVYAASGSRQILALLLAPCALQDLRKVDL